MKHPEMVSASDLIKIFPETSWNKWRDLIDAGTFGPPDRSTKRSVRVPLDKVKRHVSEHGAPRIGVRSNSKVRDQVIYFDSSLTEITPANSLTAEEREALLAPAPEGDSELIDWGTVHKIAGLVMRSRNCRVSISPDELDDLREMLTRFAQRIEHTHWRDARMRSSAI